MNLVTWMHMSLANQLTLNHFKTEYMIIGMRSNRKFKQTDVQSEIHISDTSIDRVKTTKLLCIYLDETLSLKTQIDQITKKIDAGLGILS